MDTYHRRLAAAGSDLDTLRIMAERTKIANKYGNKDNWSGIAPAEIRDALQAASGVRDRLLQEARAAVLPPLLAALRGFILQYAEERRRQGRLEFHDLLVQARDLLRRDASVRRALKAQFSHLLIDEFQDTDPLQIEIAVLLAGSDSDSPPPAWQEAAVEEGRLFFVGDPKQSIYRFRRADIALYQAVQRRFADRTVRLTQNFRSLRPVIDWVNAVFAPLLGEGAADGQAPYTELVARWEPPAEAGITVRILGEPAAENIEPVRAREAAELARLIQTAKGEGWPVAEKDSDGGRVFRPARYADIAILMPTRTALPPIEQALEEAGIPYRVESRSLVYNTQEVRDLLTILRSLDDPTDEVALVAALRSPAFGCGDDDLLRFSQAGGRWDYRVDPPASLPPDDPVVAAMAALHDLHKRRWWESINGIVEAVIRERRLFELAFAHRRPRERWQRLRFLLDQARAFAEEGGATLRQFIDWAERQAEEGTRVVETVVPEADDDAVRIMTIHASKGLEFPIVALVGLNVERRGRSEGARVLWGPRRATRGAHWVEGHAHSRRPASRIWLRSRRRWTSRRSCVSCTSPPRGPATISWSACTTRPGRRATPPDCTSGARRYRTSGGQRLSAKAQPAAPPEKPPLPFADGPEQRRGWLDARERRLKALSRAPVIAATAIARSAAGPTDDPNLQKEAPIEEIPPWRRGRAGTALGRAVHAVLQSIDLASGAGVEGAARAQAAAEGIPDRSDEVARLVRAALNAPSVREAVGGRYWREVYVAAPVDGMTVEGFIDLLYETGEGLVIVDYKTDAVPGEEELAAALARYRLQGAAYALALQEALGRPVAGCRFVFAQASDDRERELADLPAAMAAVRAEIRRLSAAGGGRGLICNSLATES